MQIDELLRMVEEEEGVGWVIAIMGHGHIPDCDIIVVVVCAWMTLAPPNNERKMIAVLESLSRIITVCPVIVAKRTS